MDKRTTIYDIAEKLGISTATVNRALTGKSRVKEETRALVLKTAEEMGFRPNTLARSLARRKLRFAVVGFTSFPEFHGAFLDGVREAAEDLRDYNVEVDCYSYDKGASDTPEALKYLDDLLAGIADKHYDGALVLARQSDGFAALNDCGVYVATAINDIAPEQRRFYIGYNSNIAGHMAAEMIYRWLPDRSAPVAIASGWKDTGVHGEIVRGFEDQLRHTPLNLCSVCYNHDNEETAYEQTLRLLDDCPTLGAIYINSFNYHGVIRAVRERGRDGDLLLVTSDISRELRDLIASGVVTASIFQNQYEQGRVGLRLLYDALANNVSVADHTLIKPEIILRSNLELYGPADARP